MSNAKGAIPLTTHACIAHGQQKGLWAFELQVCRRCRMPCHAMLLRTVRRLTCAVAGRFVASSVASLRCIMPACMRNGLHGRIGHPRPSRRALWRNPSCVSARLPGRACATCPVDALRMYRVRQDKPLAALGVALHASA